VTAIVLPFSLFSTRSTQGRKKEKKRERRNGSFVGKGGRKKKKNFYSSICIGMQDKGKVNRTSEKKEKRRGAFAPSAIADARFIGEERREEENAAIITGSHGGKGKRGEKVALLRDLLIDLLRRRGRKKRGEKERGEGRTLWRM